MPKGGAVDLGNKLVGAPARQRALAAHGGAGRRTPDRRRQRGSRAAAGRLHAGRSRRRPDCQQAAGPAAEEARADGRSGRFDRPLDGAGGLEIDRRLAGRLAGRQVELAAAVRDAAGNGPFDQDGRRPSLRVGPGVPQTRRRKNAQPGNGEAARRRHAGTARTHCRLAKDRAAAGNGGRRRPINTGNCWTSCWRRCILTAARRPTAFSGCG